MIVCLLCSFNSLLPEKFFCQPSLLCFAILITWHCQGQTYLLPLIVTYSAFHFPALHSFLYSSWMGEFFPLRRTLMGLKGKECLRSCYSSSSVNCFEVTRVIHRNLFLLLQTLGPVQGFVFHGIFLFLLPGNRHLANDTTTSTPPNV